VLSIIAGKDPADKYTLRQPVNVPNYVKELNMEGLRGAHLGVPRDLFQSDHASKQAPEIIVKFNKALKVLESLGAIIVDPVDYPGITEIENRTSEMIVVLTDLKVRIHSSLLQKAMLT
jgi:amidase